MVNNATAGTMQHRVQYIFGLAGME